MLRIHIPKHFEKLGIISMMKKILEGYIKLQKEGKIPSSESSFDGYNQASSVDPVKRFLEMVISDDKFEDPSTRENIIIYYTSKLYYLRGTLRVFEILKEMESLHGFKVGEFQYSPSELIIKIDTLKTQDITLFLEYLKAFMGAILYYADIKEVIDQVTLNLEVGVTSQIGALANFYTHYIITEEVVE